MKKVLFVFPTFWDKKQLESCRAGWKDRFEIEFAGPTDEERFWDIDVFDFIQETRDRFRGCIDGVTSTSDYPGVTVAAQIAKELHLPGPRPEAVIRCSHKYYSRLGQREVVPDVTPRFCLIDPKQPPEAAAAFPFPWFIKPVKGAFSVMARRIDSREQLQAFLDRPALREFLSSYMHTFDRLVERLTPFGVGGGYMLAEELLRGRLVTVEGYVHEGEVSILGIVDSVLHSKTGSFARFDYPSRLPEDVQWRMERVVRALLPHLGLDQTLFNVEMCYDPTMDRVWIVEVNPRLAGQFGDLYQKVDGTSSYEIALSLSVGERPLVRKSRGDHRAAASIPLRVYEPVRVEAAPSETDIERVQNLFPGALVWVECRPGQDLSDFEWFEDGRSYRYAVVNAAASSQKALARLRTTIEKELGFEFSRIDSTSSTDEKPGR